MIERFARVRGEVFVDLAVLLVTPPRTCLKSSRSGSISNLAVAAVAEHLE
jgi:hypothetical protein